MSYQQELDAFSEKYKYQTLAAGGGNFRYLLAGPEEAEHTLVFLNGGMNVSGMWKDYVAPLSGEFRVLLFDYPMEFTTNQDLVTGMDAFFTALHIEKPVLIGASDGGMIAQIYTQKYRDKAGGLVLISAGGMDRKTIRDLKRKYFFAPLMLGYLKRCNYEKMKPTLVKAGMRHAKNESSENQAYVKDMFTEIFRNYKQEKDVHITGLLVDLMNQKPVTSADFASLAGKILLILPDRDFFTPEMQKNLIGLMHDPEVKYINGGHLSTVLRAQEYITMIRTFVRGIQK